MHPVTAAMLVSRSTPKADAPKELLARAKAGEQVKVGGGALWIHYPEGAGTYRGQRDSKSQ